MSPMRRNFCCAVCGEEIWDSLSRYTSGPFEGEISQPKKPHLGVRFWTVLLNWSGHIAEISLCKDCELTRENIVAVWAGILERDYVERQDTVKMALGNRPHTPEQAARSKKMRRVMQMDFPVCVLSVRTWVQKHG